MQVLNDEYKVSPVYDAIKDLTADISTNIENVIRSNQLKTEEEAAKNELFKKSKYEFVPKKSDSEKTQEDKIKSIIDHVPYVQKKLTMIIFLHILKIP